MGRAQLRPQIRTRWAASPSPARPQLASSRRQGAMPEPGRNDGGGAALQRQGRRIGSGEKRRIATVGRSYGRGTRQAGPGW